MTALDPYPADLAELDDLPANASVVTDMDRLVRALNRIAVALEGRQPVQSAPQRPVAPLQALPPVQAVEPVQKPPCPYHGLDKVRTSSKGPGFFCSAKAMQGQPANDRGYCTWHS